MPKTFRSKEQIVEDIQKRIDTHVKNIEALDTKRIDLEATIAKHKKNITDLELKKQKTLESKSRNGKPKSQEKLLMEAIKAKGLTLEEVMAKLG